MIEYKPFEVNYKIESVTSPSGDRLYRTPEGDFPSATTVISDTQDKSFLDRWRKRIGKEEAARITRQSADFGARMHAAIENRIKTGSLGACRFDVKAAWGDLKQEFEENLTIVHGCEVSMWSKTIGVSGTADCFGYWAGRPAIIDFKTSRSTKRKEWIEHYFIQGVFYATMLQERFDFVAEDIVIPIFSNKGESNVFRAKLSEYYRPALRVLEQYRRTQETILSET